MPSPKQPDATDYRSIPPAYPNGRFALEDKGGEIAVLMRDFLGRKLKRS